MAGDGEKRPVELPRLQGARQVDDDNNHSGPTKYFQYGNGTLHDGDGSLSNTGVQLGVVVTCVSGGWRLAGGWLAVFVGGEPAGRLRCHGHWHIRNTRDKINSYFTGPSRHPYSGISNCKSRVTAARLPE